MNVEMSAEILKVQEPPIKVYINNELHEVTHWHEENDTVWFVTTNDTRIQLHNDDVVQLHSSESWRFLHQTP